MSVKAGWLNWFATGSTVARYQARGDRWIAVNPRIIDGDGIISSRSQMKSTTF
jgi:hypothetical protein